MGTVMVDQIGPQGALILDTDTTLSEQAKNEILLRALPGATVERYHGVRVVRFENQIILKKQVTHLGKPWPEFLKRIQIPKSWVEVHAQALADGLIPRFVGIYHYHAVTVFVDFDPSTYVLRKANNSAAHVSTNDLFQAQTSGSFSRVDSNGNTLTSVRDDEFARYLAGRLSTVDPRVGVFRRFNAEFFDDQWVNVLDAVNEMHQGRWPDLFHGEWPGFYLEYRFDSWVRQHALPDLVAFQKAKKAGALDFDLVFNRGTEAEYYGDLKSSDIRQHESPGNDAKDVQRCIEKYGRLWYVIYEHETRHARDTGGMDVVIAWNELKRHLGQVKRDYDETSYAKKLKEAVRFKKMAILEVNSANFNVVLRDFHQGRQATGEARALKVMISKRNIDNFLVYSEGCDVSRSSRSVADRRQ